MQQHIKALSYFRIAAWFALAILAFAAPATAQVTFGARVSHSSIGTNMPFTYTIGVTNTSGFTSTFRVTSSFFNAWVMEVGATNTPSSSIYTNDNGVPTFIFPNLPVNFIGTGQLTVFATNSTTLTNFVDIFLDSQTNIFETDVLVTTVTNVTLTQSDLSVGIQVPAAPILVNDNFSYTVTVTNSGSFPVSNVVLSNLLPSGLTFRNVSSSNRANISIGNLAANAGRRYTILATATNSGSMTVTASVTGSGITDTNSANNIVSANLQVEALVTNILIATNLTAPRLNHQNALIEQQIRLVNISTSSVASARVLVSGLSYWLRNAVGTNSGIPFVAYTAPLAAGQSVDLLMQYFVPSRNTNDLVVLNSSYLAVPTSAFSVVAPTNFTLAVTNIAFIPDKGVLLEFPAVPGRSYSIFYTDGSSLTNWLRAIPSIVAQANKVQWIDSGPPKTICVPTNASCLYRVLQNP